MITLQFDNAHDDKGVKPVEYMEGHYLYLCCPAVETSTWKGGMFQEFHPFTISSAPDEPVTRDLTLTLTLTLTPNLTLPLTLPLPLTLMRQVLEVNIRVMPSPYSWTNKVARYLQPSPSPYPNPKPNPHPNPHPHPNQVARYLQLLDPNNTGEVELATRNPTTGVTTLGKVIGPDGKPFFRVDAPHGIVSRVIGSTRTARRAVAAT